MQQRRPERYDQDQCGDADRRLRHHDREQKGGTPGRRRPGLGAPALNGVEESEPEHQVGGRAMVELHRGNILEKVGP